MTISIIAAVSENNVIGRNNRLPWHLPADMKFFKEKTMGHCIIMGRKNYDSIPKKFQPLPGRINIIISRNHDLKIPKATVVHSLKEAIMVARDNNETECFIIGGGEIYKQALEYCDKIYLTQIHHNFEGDVFFPELKKEQWKELSRTDYPKDEKNDCAFSIIELQKSIPHSIG